jgi:nitrite reductase/ring-hydroxylating ferredoxin subunit
MAMTRALAYKRLQRESRCLVRLAGTEILVLEVRGRVYAVENLCPHQGRPLDDGLLDAEAGTLTCLYHQWCFRLGDGGACDGSARLRTFPVRVDDGYVWIETDAAGAAF